MKRPTTPVPITDKNGRETVVHKAVQNPVLANDRIKSAPSPSVYDEFGHVITYSPSGLSYEDIKSELVERGKYLGNRRLTDQNTYALAQSLVTMIDEDKSDRDLLEPTNLNFHDVRSKLSGLHFVKESLSDFERGVLSLAESMLHKIDEDRTR